jgi:hypothetical protein
LQHTRRSFQTIKISEIPVDENLLEHLSRAHCPDYYVEDKRQRKADTPDHHDVPNIEPVHILPAPDKRVHKTKKAQNCVEYTFLLE